MTRLVAAALVAGAAGCATGPQPVEPAPLAQLDPATCPSLMTEGPLSVVYPARAYETGQEGWVRLRFDIDSAGAATHIRQMGASPKGIFDAAARSMLERTKFATVDRKDCEFVIEYKKKDAPK